MNIKAVGAVVLLIVSIMLSSAKAHQHMSLESEGQLNNSIKVSASELSDRTGLRYVGGLVEKELITNYLAQLQAIESDNFDQLRAGQIKRDHGKFHVTLINPYEIKKISQSKINNLLASDTAIEFQVKGLGRVFKEQSKAKEQARTYFVVLTSPQADELRKTLGLAPKDFHITLGFSPSDIFGVRKDESTLVNISQ